MKERTGPTDGLYKTSMRFTEIWRLLYSGSGRKCGNNTMYEAKRILEQAFQDMTTERTTWFAALGHSLHTMPVSSGSAGIIPALKQ